MLVWLSFPPEFRGAPSSGHQFGLSCCRESGPSPAISHKHCIDCGVLRTSAWFGKAPTRTGLKGQCRPCIALYDQGRREIHKAHREAQTPITEKWCSACKETLPASHFDKVSGTKDGCKWGCRACVRIQHDVRMAERNKRLKNRTLVLAGGKERVCSECNTCKPWTEFFASTQSNIGIESHCKQCKRNTYERLLRSRQKIEN